MLQVLALIAAANSEEASGSGFSFVQLLIAIITTAIVTAVFTVFVDEPLQTPFRAIRNRVTSMARGAWRGAFNKAEEPSTRESPPEAQQEPNLDQKALDLQKSREQLAIEILAEEQRLESAKRSLGFSFDEFRRQISGQPREDADRE
jgi:hypothetical protein